MEKNPTATVSFTSTSHHQQKMNKKKGKKKSNFVDLMTTGMHIKIQCYNVFSYICKVQNYLLNIFNHIFTKKTNQTCAKPKWETIKWQTQTTFVKWCKRRKCVVHLIIAQILQRVNIKLSWIFVWDGFKCFCNL